MQENIEKEDRKEIIKPETSVKKLSHAAKKTIDLTKRKRLDLITVQKKNQFIKAIESSGDMRVAAAQSGLELNAVKKILSQDVRFAESVSRAHALYLGGLEAHARKLAVEGVEEDVYHQGEVVGQKTVYDSGLLKVLLKAADKDKYGDKKTVDTNTNININDTTSRNKLAGLLGVKLDSVKTIEDDIDGEFTAE